MTDYQHQIETLMLVLEAALADISILETATAGELEALHDFACQYIVELLDALTDEELFSPDEQPEVAAVTDVAEQCWALLCLKRPWTVLSTCNGSTTWWVAGGESVALAAFRQWCKADPFAECQQCGDTNWHIVDVSAAIEPGSDALVITATEVAELLEHCDESSL